MNIPSISLIMFLWLPFAAASLFHFIGEVVDSVLNPILSPTDSDLANIKLCLYTGITPNEYESVQIVNAVDLMDKLDDSKPTIFYVFGWGETANSTSVRTVLGAYLERGDHNVILVNWEEIAANPYPLAAGGVGDVGSTVAKAVNELVNAGLNSNTLHVVGHSLGAQVAGFIGRTVNFTMPRITGLDPAGPEFYILIPELTATDAEFVDVIHTDAGGYGTAEHDGTVNFYPNGGTRYQPGCPSFVEILSEEDFCSHHRSWYYFAESVENESAFVGCSCSSYKEFMSNSSCSGTEVVMGYATPTTARGKYYLQTNSASVFGRGLNGTTYTK